MKKLTRKLFISILSMAFAVIAIGTTTFAEKIKSAPIIFLLFSHTTFVL